MLFVDDRSSHRSSADFGDDGDVGRQKKEKIDDLRIDRRITAAVEFIFRSTSRPYADLAEDTGRIDRVRWRRGGGGYDERQRRRSD